jgi:hypothetical protein
MFGRATAARVALLSREGAAAPDHHELGEVLRCVGRERRERFEGPTMNRDIAVGLLDRLHTAQNEFYAGGSGAALQQLLAPNVTWTVPGDNRIAGTYRGLEEVFDYFRARRDLADHTFQMKRRDVLVGDGDRLYEVIDRQIAACWLLPLDQGAFDAVWSV